jgi:hypothetical protein
VHLELGPHIPHSARGVAASREEDIERGVEGDRVDSREVTVVAANDLVVLEIPAFDRLGKKRA